MTDEDLSIAEKVSALRAAREHLACCRASVESAETALREIECALFNDLRPLCRGLDDCIKGEVTGERVSPRAVIEFIIEAMLRGVLAVVESKETP